MYLAKFRNNPKLIRVEEVLSQVIPSWSRLSMKATRGIARQLYIEQNRVVSDGIYEYVHVEYFRDLLAEGSKTASAAEAARILGLSKSMIQVYRRTSRLTAISGPGIDSAREYKFLRSDLEALLSSRVQGQS